MYQVVVMSVDLYISELAGLFSVSIWVVLFLGVPPVCALLGLKEMFSWGLVVPFGCEDCLPSALAPFAIVCCRFLD